jgi:hypothetical protein
MRQDSQPMNQSQANKGLPRSISFLAVKPDGFDEASVSAFRDDD